VGGFPSPPLTTREPLKAAAGVRASRRRPERPTWTQRGRRWDAAPKCRGRAWFSSTRDIFPDRRNALAKVCVAGGDGVAPWYVVPADRKWFRNWAVSSLLLEALCGLGLAWPPATFDVDAERRRLQAMP
jgi:hypothetical protein